jgi:hypothetical protein
VQVLVESKVEKWEEEKGEKKRRTTRFKESTRSNFFKLVFR